MTNPIISMAMQLLHSLTDEDARAHSFCNYHVEGLDYLCLLRTPRMTVKAYCFAPELGGTTGHDGWVVWPHNHRYRFDHVTLTGQVDNVLLDITSTSDRDGDWDANLYVYDGTGSRGTVTRVGAAALKVSGTLSTITGEGFEMYDLDRLHTIRVRGETIAIQIQYEDQRERTLMAVPKIGLVAYRPPQCGADNHMLYRSMPQSRVRELRELVSQALVVAA